MFLGFTRTEDVVRSEMAHKTNNTTHDNTSAVELVRFGSFVRRRLDGLGERLASTDGCGQATRVWCWLAGGVSSHVGLEQQQQKPCGVEW